MVERNYSFNVGENVAANVIVTSEKPNEIGDNIVRLTYTASGIDLAVYDKRTDVWDRTTATTFDENIIYLLSQDADIVKTADTSYYYILDVDTVDDDMIDVTPMPTQITFVSDKDE